MNKEILLLLHENIKTEKENTEMLFKRRIDDLREYQKQTINRVEKIKEEYFPKEIHYMMMRVFKNGERDDYFRKRLNLSNTRADLYIDNGLVKVLNYKGDRIKKNTLEKEIYDSWSYECYAIKIKQYKNKLDLINDFLDDLMKDIEEFYLYIANEIKKIEEEKRKKNEVILRSLNSLEKQEENKESRKVKIIIEIEEEV